MLLFFCRLPVLSAAGNRPSHLAAKVLVDKSPYLADIFRREPARTNGGFPEMFLKALFFKRSLA